MRLFLAPLEFQIKGGSGQHPVSHSRCGFGEGGGLIIEAPRSQEPPQVWGFTSHRIVNRGG